MFIDYKKALQKDSLISMVESPALIEYFNSSVPTGTKYVVEGDNLLLVAEDELNLGGLIFDLSDAQKEILGENYSIVDVFEYIDNAQDPVKLKMLKEGYIIVNGKEMPIERMYFNPFKNIKYGASEIQLNPNPLPEPIAVTISANGVSKLLSLQRKQIKSATARIFESDENEIFRIKYLIDVKHQKFDFSYTYDFSRASSAKEIYEIFNLVYGILSGNGVLGGIHLKNPTVPQTEVEQYRILVNLWEKVYRIENIIDKKIVPNCKEMYYSDLYLIETLYQTLINKQPLKVKLNIKSFELDKSYDYEHLSGLIGVKTLFSFNCNEEISIFGKIYSLPKIIFTENCAISDVVDCGDKYKVTLAYNEEDAVTGFLCFPTEEDRDKYNESLDIDTLLANLRSVEDFL